MIRLAQTSRRTLIALLAGSFIVVGCAGPPPGDARSYVPAVTQDDVITTSAQPQDFAYDGVNGNQNNGNGWGAHGARITRTSRGDLYTTYVTNNRDPNLVNWTLAKQSAGGGGWQVVTAGTTEKDNPPQVLRGPRDQIYLISLTAGGSALRGAPVIWDSVSGQTRAIPGHWLTDANCAHGRGLCIETASTLYISASIDSAGNIAFMEDVLCTMFTLPNGHPPRCRSVDVPGTYNWAYRSAASRRWTGHQWQTNYRQAYNFLFLDRGTMTAIGTRDILALEARTSCPGGYCFDQVRREHWANVNGRPSAANVLRRTHGSPNIASAEDVYVDTSGRTHILYSLQDHSEGGAYQNRNMVVDQHGRILKDVPSPIRYVNLSRILQDARGRFWIYSIGPGKNATCTIRISGGTRGDRDGTSMGPATQLPLNESCGGVERNFDAVPRVGAQLSNSIDGVFATDLGASWIHYRIRLPPLPPKGRGPKPTPPPKPPPSPSPVPRSAYESLVVGDHPLAYWPLQEPGGGQARDESGNGLSATYVGGVEFGLPGPVVSPPGKAIQLYGSAAFVDAGQASQFALQSGTVEIWVKTKQLSAGLIVRALAYGLFIHNGTLGLYDWGANAWRDSAAVIADGKWHYIVESFQSGVPNGTTIYADGQSVLTTTMTAASQSEDLVLGAQNGSGFFLAGELAEAAVYPSLLSAAQVSAHYHQALAP